jgi:hypothetical protein
LTKHDNVCIAADDIDGDGKVEVAVGAMWNPGNTTDPAESGSVHYLIRPQDPTLKWEPVKLHHEPTVHRMRWVRAEGKRRLVVVPLHGRGNKDGAGAGVRILAYDKPDDPRSEWKTTLLDDSLHKTHNFDVLRRQGRADRLIFAGREGLVTMEANGERARKRSPEGMDEGAGEVRFGRSGARGRLLVATIEPMHGDKVVVYLGDRSTPDAPWDRRVLDDSFKEGHALACADLLGLGRDQVVAGWRLPNQEGKVGIKIYVPADETLSKWEAHDLDVKPDGDASGMACEDLVAGDLDGDGRLDIVAAGRKTKNLKIYWNRTAPSRAAGE